MGRAPEMLRRKGDFAVLQRSSKSKMHPLLVARFVPNDLGVTRFGLSTGKRLGGAVVRNRVRRRLRAAIRSHAPELVPGWDVLIVARPPSAHAAYGDLDSALQRVLAAGRVLRSGAVPAGSSAAEAQVVAGRADPSKVTTQAPVA
jgi:ribonuclease P protein component